MQFTDEQIARVTHEANRAVQMVTGDPAPSPPWDEAPDWQRDSAIAGVRAARQGRTPEESHLGWMAQKEADGWVYGEVKDEHAKTHPCLVPYRELPPEQQAKDHVFVGIVEALAGSTPSDRDHIQVYQDAKGEFRWQRIAANHRKVATSGEGYVNESTAIDAARRNNPGIAVRVGL